jgi:hypothetical protein
MGRPFGQAMARTVKQVRRHDKRLGFFVLFVSFVVRDLPSMQQRAKPVPQ